MSVAVFRPWGALKFLWSGLVGAWRLVRRLVYLGLILVLAAFVIGFFVVKTPRDQPYRDLSPYVADCREGLEKGWSILTDESLIQGAQTDDTADTEEEALLAQDPGGTWKRRLRCALQRHVIPASGPNAPIDYYLGFLEFDEDGGPFAVDPPDQVAGLGEGERQDMKTCKPNFFSQLDILKAHLRDTEKDAIDCTDRCNAWRCGQGRPRHNYVVVFVHGWRHDAALGDADVGHLRRYLAHAARFLAERCERDPRDLYCNTKVTGIYVGWRGARVDEKYLQRQWWRGLGVPVGEFAAGATLFDRKPVSEKVAPGVISALRSLEEVLRMRPKTTEWGGAAGGVGAPGPVLAFRAERDARNNRMIVFKHSLGGNLLITGLQDDLIKAVRRHRPGDLMPPVLGDLVVLINPAAEAAKWTAIQREVWSRIPYLEDSTTGLDDIIAGHAFFPRHQTPVVLAVTAAMDFPVGGVRQTDQKWLGGDNVPFQNYQSVIKKELKKTHSYDWATHDLFPAFRFDFRPLASIVEYRMNRPQLADVLRNFPFQNTDQESTRTIGNLDPPRPADGLLVYKKYHSAAPFGTTHELTLLAADRAQDIPGYRTLADARLDCPAANHWLTLALQGDEPNGINWDSLKLVPPPRPECGEGGPAGHLMHGFNLGGTAAITRATDPFWNVRVRDALAAHDGYLFSPFICVMNQFVMDDITETPGVPDPRCEPPRPPGAPAGR